MSSFTARRLPQHTGEAAWNAILPPAPAPTPIAASATCDVAIVGAGFAGLSAARRVRQLRPDARIALLDAGCVAEGAAGRNSGFMIDLPHELQSDDYAGAASGSDQVMTALNRSAIRFGRDAVDEYAINPAYFDPAGKVNGAATAASDAQNVSYAKHLQNLNEPYEMLDAQAMRDLTGSSYYRSGLYTPGTVILQPAGYVRGLAAGLRPDIALYEQSPVDSITKTGPDWNITSRGYTLTAGQVILANNGHLESFGIQRGHLMHVILFAAMTQELAPEALAALGGAPRWGITPSDPMGTTMRRIDTALGGNRIVTRTCAEFRPSMRASGSGFARATRRMRENFDARFPGLKSVAMEYVWAGHLCLSLNSVSVVGEIEDGLFAACCQNGLGTARGTLTGIAAAELASGATSPISNYFAAEDAPRKLPPPPFASIGANAVLRGKEHKARAE